jgi:hypothetical protein
MADRRRIAGLSHVIDLVFLRQISQEAAPGADVAARSAFTPP